jgi:hypothetical protein
MSNQPSRRKEGQRRDRRVYGFLGVALDDQEESGPLTDLVAVLRDHARADEIPGLVRDGAILRVRYQVLAALAWMESSIDHEFHLAFADLPVSGLGF